VIAYPFGVVGIILTMVTRVPLLAAGLFARPFFKMDYPILCGVLAGSMTDPPALAFASRVTKSDRPLIAYAAVYPRVMILRSRASVNIYPTGVTPQKLGRPGVSNRW
jgi:uncharacterized transporter YbjL